MRKSILLVMIFGFGMFLVSCSCNECSRKDKTSEISQYESVNPENESVNSENESVIETDVIVSESEGSETFVFEEVLTDSQFGEEKLDVDSTCGCDVAVN